jgi:XTP/dITP diphosphohydrolase
MQEIVFATTNKSKLGQIKFVAHYYALQIKIIQAYEHFTYLKPYCEEYPSQEEIIQNGAQEIFDQIHQPLLLEDSILEIPALNNRPGLHSAEYLKQWGRKGILKELEHNEKRNASITSLLGYYNGMQLITFKKVVKGTIARYESYLYGQPRWVGPTQSEYCGGYNAIFIPNTTCTVLANLTAEESLLHGYREPNFKVALQFLSALNTKETFLNDTPNSVFLPQPSQN